MLAELIALALLHLLAYLALRRPWPAPTWTAPVPLPPPTELVFAYPAGWSPLLIEERVALSLLSPKSFVTVLAVL